MRYTNPRTLLYFTLRFYSITSSNFVDGGKTVFKWVDVRNSQVT